jgi:hypothetical protein
VTAPRGPCGSTEHKQSRTSRTPPASAVDVVYAGLLPVTSTYDWTVNHIPGFKLRAYEIARDGSE